MPRRCELGSLSRIPPGEGRNVEAGGPGGERLAIFHARDGRVFATQSDCPHKGGPLADGLVSDGVLVCPLHEQRFNLTTGEALNGSCPLRVYPLEVDAEGWLTVELP